MGEYKPIAEYGLIGNLETCALVGRDGSIDWCPTPKLESSAVFAAILDAERGGRFAIAPAASYEAAQQYAERTNVLRTTFRTDSGTATVTDFMPVIESGGIEEPQIRALYRQASCTEGTVDLEIDFAPRFDFARAETTVEAISEGAVATSDRERLFLRSPVELRADGDGARATYSIAEGDTEWFCLQYGPLAPSTDDDCERLLEETIDYWREWVRSDGNDRFVGYGQDLAIRSGLVLKLLTHRDSGALAAAPTTSLPEDIGGVRNWDYRYSWIRDGAFTVQALANLGHVTEATDFLNRFLRLSLQFDPAEIQPLYGLEHETDLSEEEIERFEGYEGSTPVRIGNEAAAQLQLDVYGELVLATSQLAQSDEEIAEDDWSAIAEVVEYVREHWSEPDSGIWELRGDPRHLTHSKVMCWVAIDRAIEMAEEGGFDAPIEEWRDARGGIRETILERGFDESVGEKGAFTQAFDDDTMDASSLLIPLSGFLPFDDERIEGTIDAVMDRLSIGDGLIRRYEGDDGLPGDEGAFVLCSFWLVNCLALAGREEEAHDLYEQVSAYANPLGLLSEEIDPETGRLLGNFPQAFSHIGLVNSALYLKQAEEDTTIEPFGDP